MDEFPWKVSWKFWVRLWRVRFKFSLQRLELLKASKYVCIVDLTFRGRRRVKKEAMDRDGRTDDGFIEEKWMANSSNVAEENGCQIAASMYTNIEEEYEGKKERGYSILLQS